jgi:hypothetical protein
MRLLLTGGIVVTAVYFKRDPGLTATEVGKYLGLSKSPVSRAVSLNRACGGKPDNLRSYDILTPNHFCLETFVLQLFG